MVQQYKKSSIIYFLLLVIKYCQADNNGLLATVSITNDLDLKNKIMDLFPVDLAPLNIIGKILNLLPTTTVALTTLDEDIHLNMTGLLKKYGYPVEVHEVETSDHYILTMFRIPSKGPAVFVQHGGICSSNEFVTLGPHAGLAYVLADAGFDVWLGNFRGSRYSRRHAYLNPDEKEFWEFSIDETGRYDQAAMIDYILEKSNQEQVKVIGHSQGTTSSYILCAEKPEYNNKISVIISLSPVAFIGNIYSPVFRLTAAPSFEIVFALLKAIGLYALFGSSEETRAFTSLFCGVPADASAICGNLFAIIFGDDPDQVVSDNLPVIFSHFPSAASINTLEHYAQLIKTKRFANYDYGMATNLEKYGTEAPPDYPVEKITTKVVIVYADGDWISRKEDVAVLVSKLPNVVESYRIPYEKFSHTDYVFGKDVKTLLYDKVVEFLHNY